MKKLVIKNEHLVDTVKKASVCVGDAYMINIANKDIGNGYKQASIITSNGTSQASIFLAVKADEDSCGSYVFGKGFGNIVQTLAANDEGDFVIKQLSDGNCRIKCGNAEVPIPVLASCTTIKVQDAKGAPVAIVKGSELKSAALRGGTSYSVTVGGRYECVRDAVCIQTEQAEDQWMLRITTTDGALAATACVDLQEHMEKEVSLTVNATCFSKIAALCGSDNIRFFIMEKQLLIVDGTDVYLMVPNAASYPDSMLKLIKNEPVKNYRFLVAKKKFLSAAEVALLGVDDKMEQAFCCVLEDGHVTVTSIDGACKTVLGTSAVDGSVRIGFNAKVIKSLLSHLGEDVEIYGEGERSIIFVTDGSEKSRAFFAPVDLDKLQAGDSDQ